MTDLAPFVKTYRAQIPAQGTAGTDQTTSLFKNEFAGSVSAVRLIANATVTASANDYRTFEVRNESTDGSGTNKITDPATANNGTSAADLTAQVPRSLTINPTASALVLAVGDVVSCVEVTPGNGVAHGGFEVEIDVTRS